MSSAKDIVVQPIDSRTASACIRRLHYSGKIVQNSFLHFGVFIDGRLEGAMQFGPSLDKKRVIGLVEGTGWNEFCELNRMAFGPALPRNSESRAISIAMRMIKKHAPHFKWVLSFSDGTQCGDGTIYRASGFVLTGIKKNSTIVVAPNGRRFSDIGIRTSRGEEFKAARALAEEAAAAKGVTLNWSGGSSMRNYFSVGFSALPGFQLRYVYFLDPACMDRLTVPVLPFSAIDDAGARMYLGKRVSSRAESTAPPVQGGDGGASPTLTLHSQEKAPDAFPT